MADLFDPLELGALLEFGLDDGPWRVESVLPPGSLLWPLDEQAPVIRLQASNHLPTKALAEVEIDVSAGGQWQYHTRGDSRLLQDGDEIARAARR